MKRLLCALPLAALAMALTASPSSAVVNLGQTGSVGGGNCGSPTEILQPTVTSGQSYVAPADGRITSWSTQAGPAPASGPVRLKVYRPVPGSTTAFTVVARDVERALVVNTLNTFNLAPGFTVRKGDVIGLGSTTGQYTCTFGAPGETRFTSFTDTAEGGTVNVTLNTVLGVRANVSAVLDPTNSVSIAKTVKNKKKGNAMLTVDVPNPGVLNLAGTGVAGSNTVVAAAGPVQVKVRALGKKKRKLLSTGKAKVTPQLTFTPTNGTAGTPVGQQIQLKKN